MTFRHPTPAGMVFRGFVFLGFLMFTRTYDKLIATISARRNVGCVRVRPRSGRLTPC